MKTIADALISREPFTRTTMGAVYRYPGLQPTLPVSGAAKHQGKVTSEYHLVIHLAEPQLE